MPLDCVENVKEVYEELDMKGVFHDYEESSCKKLCKLVEESIHLLPPDLFLEYIEKLYKRKI